MAKIAADDFFEAMNRELEDWANEITNGIQDDVEATAKECLKEVKRLSPERYGKYKKGWKVKKTSKTATSLHMTIYNATDYQLTHLLEDGHQLPQGGRTESHPHIRPAEEAASAALQRRVILTVGKNK